jgi:ABC-2 type transport system permease protein
VWQSFRAIAFKEFIHVSRNKFILRMMLMMQVLNLILLGFIDFDARDLPTVIVDQDQTSYSREFVQKLKATKTFDVKFTTSSIAQARDHVRGGRARIALVIPPDFHRDRAAHRTARVLALVDGSDSVASGQALSTIAGLSAQFAVTTEDASLGTRSSISPHSMLLFNPEGRASNFMLPGLIVTIMAGAYLGLAAGSLVREREQGTLERLLMSPLNFAGFMLGKLVPYWLASLANIAVLLTAMRFGFGVPFRGSILWVMGSFALFSMTILALGVYLAAAAQTAQELGPRQMQLGSVMMMLCGYLFPLSSLPKFLLPVSYALPSTHMVAILRGATLRGAGIEDFWMHFLYLVVAPGLLLAAAVRKFKGTINT